MPIDHEGNGGEARRPPRSLADVARASVHLRALRNVGRKTRLFRDPAWDMLLDLYVARDGGRRLSVSSLCLATDAPSTTALRWITALEQEDLIRRVRDPSDRRRSWVDLTPAAVKLLETVLRETRSRLGATEG